MASDVLFDPTKVDLVASAPDWTTAELYIVADAPWSGSDAQIRSLQDKIHTYVGFAVDGQMGSCIQNSRRCRGASSSGASAVARTYVPQMCSHAPSNRSAAMAETSKCAPNRRSAPAPANAHEPAIQDAAARDIRTPLSDTRD